MKVPYFAETTAELAIKRTILCNFLAGIAHPFPVSFAFPAVVPPTRMISLALITEKWRNQLLMEPI